MVRPGHLGQLQQRRRKLRAQLLQLAGGPGPAQLADDPGDRRADARHLGHPLALDQHLELRPQRVQRVAGVLVGPGAVGILAHQAQVGPDLLQAGGDLVLGQWHRSAFGLAVGEQRTGRGPGYDTRRFAGSNIALSSPRSSPGAPPAGPPSGRASARRPVPPPGRCLRSARHRRWPGTRWWPPPATAAGSMVRPRSSSNVTCSSPAWQRGHRPHARQRQDSGLTSQVARHQPGQLRAGQLHGRQPVVERERLVQAAVAERPRGQIGAQAAAVDERRLRARRSLADQIGGQVAQRRFLAHPAPTPASRASRQPVPPGARPPAPPPARSPPPRARRTAPAGPRKAAAGRRRRRTTAPCG